MLISTKADSAAVSPTTTGLGGEGTVAGVTEDDVADAPVPKAFVALTRNVYASPFVRPVTVAESTTDTPSANVVHVVPELDEYCTT